VVAILSLCAGAPPAFADGVFASSSGYLALALEFFLAIGLAILVGVFMLRWLVRIGRAAERRRQAKNADPQIPTARVVDPARTDRRAGP